MIENLIVAVIVIAAFAYVLRKFIFKKKSAGGDCGTCDKCSGGSGGGCH
ncbi:FeoB-associated Cys-rich membrane protein [Lautropia dentalis]|uniref:FeoB-associated Cys-rich membrane protein n=1 Tax=Lautropia dentalis TaxID=2490857 RepID=A0A426FN43_9BURK|nr:FeoB-associated Cys-rich membrane protein [Lautropia dentalis]RRN44094.1 FeoB-associated Cys-rich membrane protein [Lautropia dentalis]